MKTKPSASATSVKAPIRAVLAFVSIDLSESCARPRAAEILFHPRMIETPHRLDVAFDQDALLADHRDSVDNSVKRVEIVGYHDHSKAQSLSKVCNKRVEL